MDDTSQAQADQTEEQISDFSTETLAAKNHDDLCKDREFHIRWYNALPAQSQAEVRDKIRGEILRIRSEFGKRTEPLYPLPVRRREQG
jgi:hypothetical protein